MGKLDLRRLQMTGTLNPMLKGGGLLLLLVAATVAALAAASAGAHNDPCHAARSCPSDDHSYVWSGMSCTSSEAKRLPQDQLPVDWRGIHYWCHVVTDTGMGGGTPGIKPSCKSDRAAVATMRDRTAADVGLTAVATTVRRLARLRFTGSSSGERGNGAEKTLFRLKAQLVRARLVNHSQWELVLRDLATGATLVAGFPERDCTVGAGADLRARMSSARAALVRACGLRNVASAVALRGTATLEAVGFVPSRGTAGAGPVRLELRPVLSFDPDSCTAQR
jgi:hypothetical protein